LAGLQLYLQVKIIWRLPKPEGSMQGRDFCDLAPWEPLRQHRSTGYGWGFAGISWVACHHYQCTFGLNIYLAVQNSLQLSFGGNGFRQVILYAAGTLARLWKTAMFATKLAEGHCGVRAPLIMAQVSQDFPIKN